MKKDKTQISKFLSLVLRHKPETIQLELDENGWVDTHLLLEQMNKADFSIDLPDLKNIVETSDKKRFKFNEDCTMIRANQGHSIQVDLKLKQQTPPEFLFHGTAIKNIDSIKQQGLLKQERQHVHLSNDIETARRVGMRYGKPCILKIQARKMSNDGKAFFQSENCVWLTNKVDREYIVFPE